MKSKVLLYIKPIFYTLLYLAFLELTGLWILIADYFKAYFLFDYYEIISGLILAPSLLLFTYLANKRSFNIPQKTSYKWYLIAILIGSSYVFVQAPLYWIYNYFSGHNYYILYEFEGFRYFTNLNVYATILLVPIAEELFFREFIQKNLQQRAHPAVAIGLTSVLFAAIHLSLVSFFLFDTYLTFHHGYIALFGGLMLGFVYYKSKSIGPAIVLHMCWNLMAVIT